ncbi:hypothetical protein [Devosia sp. DBB001]|nr:hypothetical protein [Devosia sp. DBB001]
MAPPHPCSLPIRGEGDVLALPLPPSPLWGGIEGGGGR